MLMPAVLGLSAHGWLGMGGRVGRASITEMGTKLIVIRECV